MSKIKLGVGRFVFSGGFPSFDFFSLPFHMTFLCTHTWFVSLFLLIGTASYNLTELELHFYDLYNTHYPLRCPISKHNQIGH